jgi:hypothetical protein
MSYSFTLRNDVSELNGEKIGRFDAFFPSTDKDGQAVHEKDIPPYIKIDNLIFKSKKFSGNDSILIAPGSRDPINKNASPDAVYKEASKFAFFFFKIRNDESQKLVLAALLTALIGTCIDGSFAIGKIRVLIPCSVFTMIILQWLAMLLKIGGLLLAFFKGLWESK